MKRRPLEWALWCVRFFRPEFWFVSVFPAWVGWSLASGQFFPDQSLMLRGELTTVAQLTTWGASHWRVWLAIVTLGPFLGGAIMVMNDYYDRDADVFNPKKAQSPLVRGTATPQLARAWMVGLSIATLAAALLIARWFAGLLAIGLAMSFLYSAPPVRLKARPMGDILMNTIGYGALCALAGWWLGGGMGRPLPLGAFYIICCSIAAGYIPSVMMDRASDERAGLRTSAVAFGHRACWLLGLSTLVAGNLMMTGLALMGRYVPPSFALVQVSFFLVEVFAYFALIKKDVPEIVFSGACVVTLAFFGNLAAFLLVYTGALGLSP